MKDIALAYAVLSDTEKRSIYDRFGMEGIERSELLSKDQSIIPFVHVLKQSSFFIRPLLIILETMALWLWDMASYFGRGLFLRISY